MMMIMMMMVMMMIMMMMMNDNEREEEEEEEEEERRRRRGKKRRKCNRRGGGGGVGNKKAKEEEGMRMRSIKTRKRTSKNEKETNEEEMDEEVLKTEEDIEEEKNITPQIKIPIKKDKANADVLPSHVVGHIIQFENISIKLSPHQTQCRIENSVSKLQCSKKMNLQSDALPNELRGTQRKKKNF